ncbi:MAG: hypothetical protein AB7E72_08245 [Lysobacterales bacterium]
MLFGHGFDQPQQAPRLHTVAASDVAQRLIRHEQAPLPTSRQRQEIAIYVRISLIVTGRFGST